MVRLKDTHAKLRFRGLGCVLTGLVGLLILALPENIFDDLSYDLAFRWRSSVENTNAIIVYFNQNSLNEIFAPNGILKASDYTPPLSTNTPPDRRIYVTLLDRMKKAGARLVFFDCTFDKAHPEQDGAFAGAIRTNGPVILGGGLEGELVQQTGKGLGISGNSLLAPAPALKAAATNWCAIGALGVLPENVVRRLFTTNAQSASAVFLAAQFSGFTGDAEDKRWMNYYGPSPSIDSVQLAEALRAGNEGLFKGRAVFVGGEGDSPGAMDLHATPYSRTGIAGVEILATSYSNLIDGSFLRRWGLVTQGVVIAVWGFLAVAFFLCFRPRHILWMTPIAIALPLAVGFYSQWERHWWWSWAICSFAQTPMAAAWAMIANRWVPWPALAFISYRRVEGEGGGYAQAFWSALEQRGCGAICDVKADLTTTPFRPQLLALIDSVPNFILVLSKDSLNSNRINNESDVLRAEIRHAMQTRKNIIMVMTGGFKMPAPEQLPEEIRQLPNYHAFTRNDDDPWAVMDKVMASLRRPFILGRWWKTKAKG
jgi:CHASE2 domain-containing sensor protein